MVGGLLGRSLISHRRGYGVLLCSLIALAISLSVFPVMKSLGAAAAVAAVIGLAFGAAVEGMLHLD